MTHYYQDKARWRASPVFACSDSRPAGARLLTLLCAALCALAPYLLPVPRYPIVARRNPLSQVRVEDPGQVVQRPITTSSLDVIVCTQARSLGRPYDGETRPRCQDLARIPLSSTAFACSSFTRTLVFSALSPIQSFESEKVSSMMRSCSLDWSIRTQAPEQAHRTGRFQHDRSCSEALYPMLPDGIRQRQPSRWQKRLFFTGDEDLDDVVKGRLYACVGDPL